MSRTFVIDAFTLQAFELKEGKIFVEFRGVPPRMPIYVQEITEPPRSAEEPKEPEDASALSR